MAKAVGTLSMNVPTIWVYFQTDLNRGKVRRSTAGLCVLCFCHPVQRQKAAGGDVAVPMATALFTCRAPRSLLLQYSVAPLKKQSCVLLLLSLRLEDNWERTPPSLCEGDVDVTLPELRPGSSPA